VLPSIILLISTNSLKFHSYKHYVNWHQI